MGIKCFDFLLFHSSFIGLNVSRLGLHQSAITLCEFSWLYPCPHKLFDALSLMIISKYSAYVFLLSFFFFFVSCHTFHPGPIRTPSLAFLSSQTPEKAKFEEKIKGLRAICEMKKGKLVVFWSSRSIQGKPEKSGSKKIRGLTPKINW